MMPDAFNDLLGKLRTYKKKYYINMLLKGSLLFIGLTSTAYLLINTIEYYGRLDTYFRLVFFFSFLSLAIFSLYKWIAIPIYNLLHLNKMLSDEAAAEQIGKYFPEISDKLLNTLQLKKASDSENAFIKASIEQKTKEVTVFNFKEAINLNKNKKYARYVAFPLACILAILVFIPQFLTESTARIVNYSKEYAYPAPFEFVVLNEELIAYKNDPFDLRVKIDGSSLPDQVYIINNGRRSKMRKEGLDDYSFSFKNIQRNESISFEAAGFASRAYTITVISRPYMKNYLALLKFPPYLNKKPETLKNAGNMSVPEGTEIVWEFNTVDAENIYINHQNAPVEKISSRNDLFSFKKKALKTETFYVELENKHSKSKESVSCYIQVIPDEHPSINVEQFKDTILFSFISLGGNVSDDHGISKLLLHYKIKKQDSKNEVSNAIKIPIDNTSPASNFFYDWKLDSLNIKPGDKLEYFLEVWDNDGVNGSKKTRSVNFEYKVPDKTAIKKEIEDSSKKTEKELEQILSKTKNIQKDISKMEEKLKTKKSLTWQDKKTIEEIRKKQEELKEELDKLNKLHDQLQQKQDKFSELNPELAFKMEELKKLMEELLDEDTKKLYEELEKLLEQNAQKEQIQKTLEELRKKDLQMEKELERALEMFKELKFEQKLDQAIKDLKDLAEKQKDLAEKTDKKEGNNEELLKEQEKLNEEFEQLKEDLKDLEEINKSLENKKDLMDTQDKEQEISKDQQKGTESLKNNQNKKAGGSQKSAGEKMEKLGKELAEMKSEMQAEQAQEDIDDLRYILENLVRLSFDQEELMKNFKKVNQSDPRFIQLSQQQLKLKDDSKVIEDSLMALSKRVFQIKSFVTREVNSMKGYMDESMDAIKNRKPEVAAGKQQFAMTSINNLALMLDDVLKQMQEQMAQAMQQKGGGPQCKNPGKSKNPGNMGDLQKQLNQRIENLKKGNMQGQQLSEELAKLAAQQEMIRNAVKEMQKAGGKEGGKALGDLMKKMEETETDLVNKRITQETLLRQKDIMTRLLEADKAMRERELDEKRESNSGKELQRDLPPSFEKYLKAREKQIELLKTVSPNLSPYYKNEVNEYFKKIE
jgi:hypothetical protein